MVIARAKKIKDRAFELATNIKTVLLVLSLLGGGGGYKAAQAIWGPGPDEHAVHDSAMATTPPLACATAMREMRDAMIALRTTVEGQGPRIDRLETSLNNRIDELNRRMDFRFADRRTEH